MRDGRELRIGEVARRSGVAATSIRFYESIGLLPEPDRESGQRRYGEEVLGTLAFIGAAQQAGFTLREIRELLSRVETEADLAEPMRALSQRKLPEVEALIARAEHMRSWLAAAAECGCSTPAECMLFPASGDPARASGVSLEIVLVEGKSCRRAPAA